MDDIYEQRIKINQDQALSLHGGTWQFTMANIMRDDPLEHVLDIGIRLEKGPLSVTQVSPDASFYKKRLVMVSMVFWFLLFYIVAALVWWFISAGKTKWPDDHVAGGWP